MVHESVREVERQRGEPLTCIEPDRLRSAVMCTAKFTPASPIEETMQGSYAGTSRQPGDTQNSTEAAALSSSAGLPG